MVSVKTIFILLLMLLSVYIIYRLGPIIAILIISALLMISLENVVKFWMKKTLLNKPIPRSLAVLLTYAGFILGIILAITLILPPVLSQSQKLIESLAKILENVKVYNNVDLSVSGLLSQFSSVSGGVLNGAILVVNNVATFFSILVISIYISLDWVSLRRHLLNLVSPKAREYVDDTLTEVEKNVGAWLRGVATLMLIVGSASFGGLLLLNVDYPLALGILSGLLEVVPMIGPFIAVAVAAVIGFSVSPTLGIAVIGLYVIIQQVENNFIVPKVMGKVSGFSPLVILLAILIGNNFFGFVGVFLAIPITIISVVIIKRVLRYSPRN